MMSLGGWESRAANDCVTVRTVPVFVDWASCSFLQTVAE